MRRLNTGYAVRFNRLRGRRGYLFMDRFRSRIVESDADLIGLIRYLHRNPIEAGMVQSLDELAAYPWSGHGALVGARDALPFEAVGAALSLFDEDPGRARLELLSWMAREEDPTPREATPEAVPHPQPEYEPLRFEARGDFAALLRAACAHYVLAPDQLSSGSKSPRIVRARSAVAYIAVVELGETGRTVASALGVSRAAISAALDRGRLAAVEDGLWVGSGAESRRGESENLKI
jgi:hypothetical protein